MRVCADTGVVCVCMHRCVVCLCVCTHVYVCADMHKSTFASVVQDSSVCPTLKCLALWGPSAWLTFGVEWTQVPSFREDLTDCLSLIPASLQPLPCPGPRLHSHSGSCFTE